MSAPSETENDWIAQREKIIGLGERSLRKTYYPELQARLDDLERFRALLDHSNDCIFLLCAQTLDFVDVNESACRQLGCSRQELLSSTLRNILPPAALTRIQELVTTDSAHGRQQDTLITQLRKCNGGEIPVEITLRLVAFNKLWYGVAVARDITERKRAEKILLDNSRMLREMELARQIQLSLLPVAPPEIAKIRLAGCCVPATHVGGDYYDFYRRENNILDLVIADVSGHSFGAALMMAEARSVLRAQVHSFDSPGALLSSLNDLLYEDLSQADLFISLFYLKYNPANRMLTYANAGHVPPLLFRAGERSCHELDADGLILGIRKGVCFEEKEYQLDPGDRLFLYTDGITEAQDRDGEMFGKGRVCSILAERIGTSPSGLISSILVDLSAFAGTTVMEDDVTMVIMDLL